MGKVNSLDLFRAQWYRKISFGDVIFFDGSGTADLVQAGERALSNIIEVATGSNWSHCAMVWSGGHMPTIIESTIENGVSGPQVNSLPGRLVHYDGTSAWLFRLKPEVYDRIDRAAMWRALKSKVGKDKYSVRTLFDFALRPVLGWAIPALKRPHAGEEVCSQFLAEGLVAGGVEAITGVKLDPALCSPKSLAAYPIWQEPVKILEVK
jgi:hypothetical protein